MIAVARPIRCIVLLLTCLLYHRGTFCQQRDAYYNAKLAEPGTAMITLQEGYKIFSQTWGTGKTNILLLHGGPGNTHEYFEIFKTRLPAGEYRVIVYDQLGSYYSDQPADTTLWTIGRLVNEVEQVRAFYHLQDFYLLGHSFGGLLAMEYAVRFPGKLKGLIVSDRGYSQDSLRLYTSRLQQTLAADMQQSAQSRHNLTDKSDLSNSNSNGLLLVAFRRNHIIRLDTLPEPMARNAAHLNKKYMSRYRFREHWNFIDSLALIQVRTLIIGGRFDQVSETELRVMNKKIKGSTLYICPNGSHFPFWDDPDNYFSALRNFMLDNPDEKPAAPVRLK